jgi:hypothetical protein
MKSAGFVDGWGCDFLAMHVPSVPEFVGRCQPRVAYRRSEPPQRFISLVVLTPNLTLQSRVACALCTLDVARSPLCRAIRA